jgi:hypothetical protein
MSRYYERSYESYRVGLFDLNHAYNPTEAFGACWSKMTLNYRVILERYTFSYGVVGGSIPAVKSSLYLTEKTSSVGRKPRAHPSQGRQ